MTISLISPGRYVQGEGALKDLGKYLESFGKKALVVASGSGLKAWGEELKAGLKDKEYVIDNFGGKECSQIQINRLVELGKQEAVDFVIGFGGGKPIDTAKAVAHKLGNIPVVIIPTIAATDAPTSALSVIYTEEGVYEAVWTFPNNPNLVLVDTGIIAKSPARFLVAGMGDALATKFEAEANFQANNDTNAGAKATVTARTLANLCYEILLEYGPMAKAAVEEGIVTPALEQVVEANVLLSGLGFENNGVAGAHAMHDGFTVLEDVHGYYHGEKVGFCTIAQLVMEGRPAELIEEVINFNYTVGLPITLAQIGVTEDIPAKIKKVSESVPDYVHNEPFEVTAKKIYDAILGADALGRRFLGQ
jgi:glycerol dehydrogenase